MKNEKWKRILFFKIETIRSETGESKLTKQKQQSKKLTLLHFRANEDGTHFTHRGPITATYTGDWHLREGESRDIYSGCLKSKKGRW